MTMSNAAETALLGLYFTNAAHALVGDAPGLQPSATAGSLYVALHSSDPGEAGTQETNEVSYTGYGRVAVARSGAGWTVSGNTVENAATIQFGECTGGSTTATHFSVGTASTGAGQILFSGALTASRAISAGITPLYNPSALTVTVD